MSIHMLRGARHDDVPCPLCGKPRSRQDMEAHLRLAHDPAERARMEIERGRGKGHKVWWKEQLKRRWL